MNSPKLLTLLFVLFSYCLYAQDEDGPVEKPDTVRFVLAPPLRMVSHSLYRSIEFLDQRPDTVNLGLFATNTRYDIRVIPLFPLARQLDTFMTRIVDDSAGQGVLLLQLKQFTVFDINTTFSHRVAATLKASLYARTGQGYRRLAILDTTVDQYVRRPVKNSYKELFIQTSFALDRFVADALVQTPADRVPAYSRDEVIAIDSMEKSKQRGDFL